VASNASASNAVSSLLGILVWARRKELGLACGSAPYGHRIVGSRGCRHLVPDPEQRAWARKFIELRRHGFRDYRGRAIAGPSYRQIVVYLWHQNAVRPDGREFTEGTIRRWIEGELRLQAEEARQREREASTADVAQGTSA